MHFVMEGQEVIIILFLYFISILVLNLDFKLNLIVTSIGF